MNQQKNTLIKSAFYGSLRKGEYNYEAFKRQFGEENFQYKETKTIEGFQLLSLGAYPAVIKKEGSKLVVDLFEISPEAYDSVSRMERGAGYDELFLEDGSSLWIFESNRYGFPVVESGDWSKHLEEKELSY